MLAPAMRYLVVTMLVTGLLVYSGASRADEEPRRPSTAAERLAAAKAARALEQNPTGPKADGQRQAAMVVLNAPDIQVKLCANMLSAFVGEKSASHDLLLHQVLFSSMAFMIEKPAEADDDGAVYLAGIVGALKAYGKLRAGGRDARSPFFEKLLELQKHGKLETFVGDETAACRPAAETN